MSSSKSLPSYERVGSKFQDLLKLHENWILTFLKIIYTFDFDFKTEIVKEILFSAVIRITEKYEHSMLLYG